MKIKNYVSSLIIALIISVPVFSQQKSATTVMNNMVNVLKSNSIQTNFGLIIKEPNSADLHKMGGTFLMKGEKFAFTTDEMKVYFDGKTQWSYVPTINEVSISNPTEKELAQTNPLALLQTYSSKSTVRYFKNNSLKNAYSVELIPKEKSSDISKIQVVIDKADYTPLSIQLLDKKGMISTLALTKFQKGVKTDKDSFTFNSSVYKDIEINDLR